MDDCPEFRLGFLSELKKCKMIEVRFILDDKNKDGGDHVINLHIFEKETPYYQDIINTVKKYAEDRF